MGRSEKIGKRKHFQTKAKDRNGHHFKQIRVIILQLMCLLEMVSSERSSLVAISDGNSLKGSSRVSAVVHVVYMVPALPGSRITQWEQMSPVEIKHNLRTWSAAKIRSARENNYSQASNPTINVNTKFLCKANPQVVKNIFWLCYDSSSIGNIFLCTSQLLM